MDVLTCSLGLNKLVASLDLSCLHFKTVCAEQWWPRGGGLGGMAEGDKATGCPRALLVLKLKNNNNDMDAALT